MKRETEAILLRIFIGESDEYEGKPLYKYILEMLRREGIAGATVLRGLSGYGKTSIIHTTAILRLSTDLPIIIEVVDKVEKIEKIQPKIDNIIKEGLITKERVKVVFYEGNGDNSQK